jgi:cell shape-determining protein MreC
MDPLQRAGRVVVRPFENAWRGAREYDSLKRENDQLREQVAQQEGDALAAVVAVREYQELQKVVGLGLEYSNVVAQVLQYSPQNFQQTVEINVGRNQGVRPGMAVLSAAGLVGKVTEAFPTRSIVMLITDPQYTVSVKVVGDEAIPGSNEDPNLTAPDTTSTTIAPGAAASAGSSSTDPAVPPGTGDPATLDPASLDPATLDPGALDPAGSDTTAVPTTTTTTVPATTTTVPIAELAQRELGGLVGQGPGEPPIVSLIAQDRRGIRIAVGDVVATSGDCQSLAPPDLSIGRVSKVTERAGSAGPIVEMEPNADLTRLNFVVVVLYLPPAEVPGTCLAG